MKTCYAERNGEFEILRGLFDGTIAQEARSKAVAGKLTQNKTELIYNVLNAAIRRYMDQMSAPPRIEGIPRGFELDDIELADKRAKVLQKIWEANGMTVKLMQSSFYQALLDKAIFNVRPAPQLPHKVKIELAVPEFYYPICRGDNWQEPEAVIYGFRKFKSDYHLQDPMRFRVDAAMDEVIEYHDKNHFIRIEDNRALVIRHMLGEILWEEAHNIPIPHRHRGQGDGDQIVGLQEYLNLMLGSFADMIAYAANPIAVVRGTKVGGTNLPFEPRAVWELERDAQVGFLQWTGAPPTSEAQILRVFQGIEDLTGVSSPAFGREIPSGTSGNAIRSLLAGFNTRLGTKQQLMGEALTRVNRKVQLVLERIFPDVEFEINGENVRPGKPLGKPQKYTVKGRDFGGWYDNRVIFNPLDTASTYFQELDKLAKGIQSRFTTMRALGIPNVWDELERIRIEKREEADQANDMALAQQGNFMSPEKQAMQAEGDQAAMAQLLGQLKGAGMPGAAGDATADRQAKRDVKAATALPPPSSAAPVPDAGPAGPSALEEPPANLEDIMARLKGGAVSGRMALSGDAVANGKGNFNVHLENPADAAQVRQILGPLAFGATFKGIDPDKPLEPGAIEIKSQKKNLAEARKTPKGFLSVVVMGVVPTGNALVYDIGIIGEDGTLIPFGRTNAQRNIKAEQGEIIRVQVQGVSRREDDGKIKWALVSPMPVKGMPAAAPSGIKDVQRLYDQGEK